MCPTVDATKCDKKEKWKEQSKDKFYVNFYGEGYREEVIKSGVAGYERQVEADRQGTKPLYRPRSWRREERRKAKIVRKVGWHRPADAVGFFPATPGGELVKQVTQVLEEEGARIGMKLRAIETGGVSLGKQLVRADLRAGEPCGRPGCVLDLVSGGAGGPHNKSGALYKGECKLCGEDLVEAEYWGESGRTGYFRTLKHQEEVNKRDERNAFAKHLAIEHPNKQGDIRHFNIQVVSTFQKPLIREKMEAVKLQSSKADYILNSKSEHKQPKLHRVVMTRENDEAGSRRGRGGGRGRGRGGGRGQGRGGHQGAALRAQGSS